MRHEVHTRFELRWGDRARAWLCVLTLVAVGGALAFVPFGTSATPNLMAAYAFDEGSGTTITDASGNGRNGTAVNTTWAANGKYGKALNFNGSSSRVTVPDTPALRLTSAMTLEAWVNPTGSNSGWRDLIYKGNDNYYLSASSTPNNRPAGGGIIGGSYGEVFATSASPNNTWRHLAVTYDGASVRLFVNGTQVSSLPKTGNLATSTNPLTLGSDPIYGQYFQGAIDEVRIYNIALTAAQIQTDLATAVGGTADTQLPTAPSGLSATAVSSGRVDLSWTAATDNVGVSGYRIERCQGVGCSSFAQIAAPAGTATGYSDTSATASSSFSYRVRATDAAGNLGPYSNTASATTPAGADTELPTAPSGLSAAAVSSGRVDLSWTAATDNVGVSGYRIERCQGVGCSSFAQIAAPAGTATGYSDTSATASSSFSYRVRATDAAGNLGPYSNTASATTPAGADTELPTAPSGLSAAAVSSGRVDLSWTAATDNVGVSGYRIERCQGVGCSSFAQIAAPAGTATGYSDTSATASSSFSYRVRATDAAGNLGPYSNTASATTPGSAGPTPVAAYAFEEGSGTTVVDASGNGNSGAVANATWVAGGKNGKALTFNGTSSRVTIPDAASLRLTTGMTLEAWVNPSVTNGGWRDLIYKGDDNYYLSASSTPNNRPAGGGTIGGGYGEVFGTAPLATNAWTHVAITYDGADVRLYVNGLQVSSLPKSGSLAASTNPLTLGSDPIYGQYFQGAIDDVRIYNVALTSAQIQTDLATAVVQPPSDTTDPTVSVTSPSANAQVSDFVDVTADASDDVGVVGVQFFVDGDPVGSADSTSPYQVSWDTRAASNGTHTLTARARDGAGNVKLSAGVEVTVANSGSFQNEVLATGLTLPTKLAFLPDGRLLVAGLTGTVVVLPPPYTQPDPTPFLQLTNVGNNAEQGLQNIALDPDFATNRFYYVFYTLGNPNRDRLSRFTANASLTGTVAGSELVLYQDPLGAGVDHHAGAIVFGNDGKLYFTTGDEVDTPAASQSLSSPRGKIHRINKDGTAPTDNPFYDGGGSNVDSVWALGFRNPFRAFYDAPTGRFFVGDVGGNNAATAYEEVDLATAGSNYAWPNCESFCGPPYVNGIYSYPHSGRDAAVVSGFVYRGSQFPAAYVGSYFFADYAQNWIRRLTLDAGGNVTGVFDFEPPDGTADGPYGDIVDLVEGPDGALYYVDIGFDDATGQLGVSKIRRIRFVHSNMAPVAQSSADTTTGPAPLTVQFSSAGSADPEGLPLSYSWTFGDGATSSAPNPSHVYSQGGQYTARLSVSDGTNTTLANPITIRVGSPPTATILTPQDAGTFRAGDVISFSGTGNDPDTGPLPASAFSWTIDFLHEGHVHPGVPQAGVTSGTFTIPTTGHDFSGLTRYRISLTVTDADGLSATSSVAIWPQKVNLTFNSVPTGLTLYLDGIARVTPFVSDSLIGFNHTVEARNQTVGAQSYAFASWSDSGAQQHSITVPAGAQSYTATYTTVAAPASPAFVQTANSVPQTPQTTVATAFGQSQTAGNLNVVVIGWDNTTSNVVSVTDSRGNAYQVAAPTTRSSSNSQTIYYGKNIAGGANTVTVTFSGSTPYVDVRIAEYSGLDRLNPFDATSSAGGTSAQPNSGAATTTAANELLVAAGTTTGFFSGSGPGYTTRVITSPDGDILEDRVVTSTGSYNATAVMGSATWVMQLVTFRAAGS